MHAGGVTRRLPLSRPVPSGIHELEQRDQRRHDGDVAAQLGEFIYPDLGEVDAMTLARVILDGNWSPFEYDEMV